MDYNREAYEKMEAEKNELDELWKKEKDNLRKTQMVSNFLSSLSLSLSLPLSLSLSLSLSPSLPSCHSPSLNNLEVLIFIPSAQARTRKSTRGGKDEDRT